MSSIRTVPPPLLPGQRLTREEFLRRWEDLPELKNAELIDGIVYMPSPLSDWHGSVDLLVHAWLRVYADSTRGVKGAANATWLMLESVPQPDSYLRILPEYGGQARMEGKYCSGAPELVVEVCASSTAHDFGPKLSLYERAGVREYVTVSLTPAEVIWRELAGARYQSLPPAADGILRSKVLPGLWLDPAALLADDGTRVMEVLRSGLASEEHAEFLRRLGS